MTEEEKREGMIVEGTAAPRPWRLWPGVVIILLHLFLQFWFPSILVTDIGKMIGVFGGMLMGVLFPIWWLFLSRAPRRDRWAGAAAALVGIIVTRLLVDPSIGMGLAGMMFFMVFIPLLNFLLIVWALACREMSAKPRRLLMGVAILMACAIMLNLRSKGIDGQMNIGFAFRWAATSEEEILAAPEEELMPGPASPPAIIPGADWPGFRGVNRDAIVAGLKIRTDWAAAPPAKLWRRPVGPGCSSFAVRGGLVYTQEQRGEEELVSCYDLKTGKPVWRHAYKARFWDAHAGAGPRSTPTIVRGRVCTIGGTGIVKVLNAHDGSPVWSADALADTKGKLPGWSIASSPLVVADILMVAPVGNLIAYDFNTGERKWTGPPAAEKSETYSSPHLLTIAGVEQVVQTNTNGAYGILPADGIVLWEYAWPSGGRIVQPALLPGGDLLLSLGGMEKDLRRLTPVKGTDGWTFEERWTSRGLRPDYNDTVIHKGHAYGFVGSRLGCMDLETGKSKWRQRGMQGFTLLLPDQDLLLVLTEKGEVVLVEAKPEKYIELGRFQAIEGKTWNVPALAGDILLVRNAEEMAAFRLGGDIVDL